jgi:hypothetical protein
MSSRLHDVAQELLRIDEELTMDGISPHYIAVRRGPAGEIVCIRCTNRLLVDDVAARIFD